MDDEFDKLMQLLSEKAEEKEKKLDEIFQKCTEFFERYKYIIAEGTDEEKESIQMKMSVLRDRLKQENEKTQTTLGITTEGIKKLSEDPKHFTPKQWEFLQNAQKKLFEEKMEQEKRMSEVKEKRENELKAKHKKKPVSRKSGWMKT